MAEHENFSENAIYLTVRTYEDGMSVIMNADTDTFYVKKILSEYNASAYEYLKTHEDIQIPEVYSAKEEDGKLTVIEEFIHGKKLDELLLGESKLSFLDRKRILFAVCEGLNFLHNAVPGIVHGNLKASDILIMDDGSVKLTGYNTALTDANADIAALGALIRQMLPESAEALKIADMAEKADMTVSDIKEALGKLSDPNDRGHMPGFGSRSIGVRIVSWAVLAAAVAAAIYGIFRYQKAGEGDVTVQETAAVSQGEQSGQPEASSGSIEAVTESSEDDSEETGASSGSSEELSEASGASSGLAEAASELSESTKGDSEETSLAEAASDEEVSSESTEETSKTSEASAASSEVSSSGRGTSLEASAAEESSTGSSRETSEIKETSAGSSQEASGSKETSTGSSEEMSESKEISSESSKETDETKEASSVSTKETSDTEDIFSGSSEEASEESEALAVSVDVSSSVTDTSSEAVSGSSEESAETKEVSSVSSAETCETSTASGSGQETSAESEAEEAAMQAKEAFEEAMRSAAADISREGDSDKVIEKLKAYIAEADDHEDQYGSDSSETAGLFRKELAAAAMNAAVRQEDIYRVSGSLYNASEALKIYEAIGDYTDDAETASMAFLDSINENAARSVENGKYNNAEKLYAYLSGLSYDGAGDGLKNVAYQRALKVMETGNYLEAAEMFDGVSGFKDADDQAASCRNHYMSAVGPIDNMESGIEVHWVPVEEADGYFVTMDGSVTVDVGSDVTSHAFTEANTNGQEYSFTVTPYFIDEDGNKDKGGESPAVTWTFLNKMWLQNLTSDHAGEITVTWTPNDYAGYYEVAYGLAPELTSAVVIMYMADQPYTQTITGLVPGTYYYVRVRSSVLGADNKVYNGVWSNTEPIIVRDYAVMWE